MTIARSLHPSANTAGAAEKRPDAERFADWLLTIGCVAGLTAVTAILAYRIFHGITLVGIGGVDSFLYVKQADDMLHGKPDADATRLSFDALNYLAMKTLGVNDYALRGFIGVAACLNVVMLFFLAWRISGNALVGLAAAATYAFNPVVVSFAMTELPHTYSAAFVLMGVAAWLPTRSANVNRRSQLLYGGFAGCFFALAVFTHEDLIFLAALFGLLTAFADPHRKSSAWSARLQQAVAPLGCFALGFAAGFAVLMLITGIGPAELARQVPARSSYIAQTTALAGGHFFANTAPRIFASIKELMDLNLQRLAIVALFAVPVAFAVFRGRRLKTALLLEGAMLGYFFLFFIMQAFLETNSDYARVFVPPLGLGILVTFCGGYLIAKSLLEKSAIRFPAAILALLTVGFCAYAVAPYHLNKFRFPAVSPSRQLYDALSGEVGPGKRLLLPTCFGLDVPWWGPGSPVYFGGNAVSLLVNELEPFDAFVAKHSIRYVFVASAFNALEIMSQPQIAHVFSTFYGVELPPEIKGILPASPSLRITWPPQACAFEAELLRKAALAHGGRLISSLPALGDVYALP